MLLSRVVPLLAAATACTRHPVVPEDERRPKVLESQWDLCGNGVHDPVFPCGGPFDIPEPNSPDSPNVITCSPSPVARGDTVTCTIELPKWQVPYATSDPDSVFKAVVILADSTGRFNESPGDSIYVIDIAYEDGAASTTANVWKWQLKGPAVARSEFSVLMYATDTLGATHKVTGKSGFVIGSYPLGHAVGVSATTSTVPAELEYSLPELVRDSSGGTRALWGRTYSPILNDGTSSDSVWLLKAAGLHPIDTSAVSLASVSSGPNKSLRYLNSSLALSPVVTHYSVALLGQGVWASAQDGSGPGSPTPPYCDRFTQGNLFTLLDEYVRKHEGEVSGSDSHFDYFKEAANGSVGQALANALQRRWFRSWHLGIAGLISSELQVGIHQSGINNHRALDANLASDSHQIANCTWL